MVDKNSIHEAASLGQGRDAILGQNERGVMITAFCILAMMACFTVIIAILLGEMFADRARKYEAGFQQAGFSFIRSLH
ncbi:MAG: hypothetical protein AAFY99_13205 [Pseudomonadota bacterium]